MKAAASRIGTIVSGLLLAGCATTVTGAPVPAAAPVAAPAADTATAGEARIAAILSRMSLEHKIAQLIQPQINSFTPADMERYRFGSYLNGGNGGPYGDEFAPADRWLRLADEMFDASTRPLPGGEPVIPTMWGTDAVHGHTNVVQATIFPHNVALGAANDADLVRRIGAATAAEIAATGIDWNFSPTIAVARDLRWGRAYESYSEDPAIVGPLGAALVEGLQGPARPDGKIAPGHVIATAKHFFGDGGTTRGVDQGDVEGDLDALKRVHAAPYKAAIAAGVDAIMASFNSINGTKMHGNRALLTDYLRGELGFDGLVVGDWNGHAQIPGCRNDDCPQALLAGLDIYMVPDDWKALHANLLRQVKDGTIPMARLDEAVARVLRAKLRAGLLDAGAKRPSQRTFGGRMDLLGSSEHRAIAREAVAKSQVILKNDGVLPLKRGARVLVAGAAADSVGQAAGGWTLTWQGGRDLERSRFPGATSIWQGIEQAVTQGGGSAALAPDGRFTQRPDVAIVVFGELPYAEFEGDQKDLVLRDEEGLALLRAFRAQGIRTVAVFLSGRPMWMNREINAADAFVASWLPGSEGAGVADVLIGRQAATGRLPFRWPSRCEGSPLTGADVAFPLGYRRDASDTTRLASLPEACSALLAADSTALFGAGRLAPNVRALAFGRSLPAERAIALTQLRGAAPAAGVTVRGIDRSAQEDAREIAFEPGSALLLEGVAPKPTAYRILYSIGQRPTEPVRLIYGNRAAGLRSLDVTRALSVAEGKDWREMIVTSACAPGLSGAIGFESTAKLTLRIATIEAVNLPATAECVL